MRLGWPAQAPGGGEVVFSPQVPPGCPINHHYTRARTRTHNLCPKKCNVSFCTLNAQRDGPGRAIIQGDDVKSYTFENGVIALGANEGTIWFSRTPMHGQYVGFFETSVMANAEFGTPMIHIGEVIVADGYDIPSMLMGIADKLELLEEQSIEDYDTYEGEIREQHFKDMRHAVQKALADQAKSNPTVAVEATA
jgi:hypothetical protein